MIQARVQIAAIPERTPFEAVAAAAARRPSPAILESSDSTARWSRHSILAFDPAEVLSVGPGQEDPFDALRQRLRLSPPGAVLPGQGIFPGGWIGHLAYEAGHAVEPTVPSHRPGRQSDETAMLPVARFGLYDTAALLDTASGEWRVMAVEWPQGRTPSGTARPPAEQRIHACRQLIADAPSVVIAPPPPSPPAVDNMTRDQYIRMVTRTREYIAAGDIFQANLSRRQTFRRVEPPIVTYLRLRRTNPAGYAAYLAWDEPRASPPTGRKAAPREIAILSASPELFLSLGDGQVITRPIKGTRPRSGDPARDEELRRELLSSPKDRAELAMIVDLERNDLGRVCEYASVRVEPQAEGGPYRLESHPTVHHLVATVTGRLRPECDTVDLLRATFPGGSITGAPKVRAMQIIRELEPTPRGIYTGSIGFFGLDGSAVLNIAIRTFAVAGDDIHLYAGGGIVADSVPQDEFAETQAKALGLCRALGVLP